MKILELTLLKSEKPITFCINGTFTVWPREEGTRVQDGNHNNGGWTVKESYTEVIEKLKKLSSKEV